MVDIQALISAVKASRKYSKHVITNVLALPSELSNCAGHIIWANCSVPAAYIIEDNNIRRYYFFVTDDPYTSPVLPDSVEKPLIAEFFYKQSGICQLNTIDFHLSNVGFKPCAHFQRMVLKSKLSNEKDMLQYCISSSPNASEIVALWNQCIADKTVLPSIDQCQKLISDNMVFSIEFNHHTAAAMMFENIGKRYVVRHVAVSLEHRRKGLAQLLLSQALSGLPESSSVMLWVEKNNIPAINLYKSLGFSEDGMFSMQWERK